MRTARLPWVALCAPDGPRDWEVVRDALDALADRGGGDALLGAEPTRSPHLLHALRHARERGLRTVVVSDGHGLTSTDRLDALHGAGASRLAVLPPWPAELLASLAAHPLRGWVAVDVEASGDVGEPVATARPLGLDVFVLRSPPEDPDAPLPTPIAAAVDAIWRQAHAAGLGLEAHGLAFTPAPRPRGTDLPPLDAALLGLVRQGFVPPSAAGGVLSGPTPDLATAAHLLAASGAPVRDLPPCVAGDGQADPGTAAHVDACEPCPARPACPGAPPDLAIAPSPPPRWTPTPPGARVAVLLPRVADQLLCGSTMPALVRALQARGANAQLHGLWDPLWHPDQLCPDLPRTLGKSVWSFLVRSLFRGPDPYGTYRPPEGVHGQALMGDEDEAHARAVDERFWSELDLSGADLIVAPGWPAAHRAWTHPSRPAGSRLVVADFHMLEDVGVWGLAGRTDAWPSEAVTVHSCFPRYARLYDRAGVPLRHVHWRPYPLYLRHLPPGPAPSTCDEVFTGGSHRRDLGQLAAALRAGDPSLPVRLAGPDPGADLPSTVRRLGYLPLADFAEAIRTSRFVVLPLAGGADHAVGISVAALALAAGRPVVAPRIPAMADHVIDGVSGVLVDPGDATALGRAAADLHRDPARLDALGQGAHAAARVGGVEAWAYEILHGRPWAGPPGTGVPRPW